MSPNNNRGGSHEQHVKSGHQGHKNDDMRQAGGRDAQSSTRGGGHEQHIKGGQQSHKND